MITDYALSLLQQAINQALQLDADLAAKLAPLDGKLMQLILRPFDNQIFIQFNATDIQLSTAAFREADMTIHSSPFGLVRLTLLPTTSMHTLLEHNIQISGDLALGLQIKQLFHGLDLDWEQQLAHFTGDVVAHQVGRVFRRSSQRMQAIKTSLQQQCSEYLHEELRLFPPPEEVNDFYQDIADISLCVERIEARLNHYRAQHATT